MQPMILRFSGKFRQTSRATRANQRVPTRRLSDRSGHERHATAIVTVERTPTRADQGSPFDGLGNDAMAMPNIAMHLRGEQEVTARRKSFLNSWRLAARGCD
jgi:hypothetical protein